LRSRAELTRSLRDRENDRHVYFSNIINLWRPFDVAPASLNRRARSEVGR
jgi:hypothetical protein